MTVLNEEGEVLRLTGPSNDGEKLIKENEPWWVKALYILGTIFLLFIFGYFVIFINIQRFIESVASNTHWMHGWGSGLVSFIIATIATRPVYAGLGRAVVWKLNKKDWITLIACVLLVIVSAYLDRNKFFAKGTAAKEICPALLRGEKPSIKVVGQGADEGLKCIPLSKEEASLALAIDKSVWAKEIVPSSIIELEALAHYDRGAVAIYIGYAKSGDPKIYDGPDFNPRALGVLKPITEDELIAYKVTQRAKLLGTENAKRLEKEAAARAAAELAERQRAAAEAEARRLQQERLAAQAAEERRVQAEKEAKAEAERKAKAESSARVTWWVVLLILVVVTAGAFMAHPIVGIIAALVLLIHLSR